jgi:hypothetical protein
MGRGGVGILRPSGRAQQNLQCLPARRQCRVQVHSVQIRLDRAARITRGNAAMTAFLEQATVAGMDGLETRQRGQRLRGAAQVALADGQHVQHVAVLGHPRQQRLGRCQRQRKLALVEQSTDAQHLGLDTGLGWLSGGQWHQKSLSISVS